MPQVSVEHSADSLASQLKFSRVQHGWQHEWQCISSICTCYGLRVGVTGAPLLPGTRSCEFFESCLAMPGAVLAQGLVVWRSCSNCLALSLFCTQWFWIDDKSATGVVRQKDMKPPVEYAGSDVYLCRTFACFGRTSNVRYDV
jgi:hypothetical protein